MGIWNLEIMSVYLNCWKHFLVDHILDTEKIKLLYDRLFQVAYNSDLINIQNTNYTKALIIATEIYNNYKFDYYEPTDVTKQRFYLESQITCNKAKATYNCGNNNDHKINQDDHYGSIYVSSNRFSPEKICLCCLAKIYLIIITKFPPSIDPVPYFVEVDFDLSTLENW